MKRRSFLASVGVVGVVPVLGDVRLFAPDPDVLTRTLMIAGSTTMQIYLRELAQAFQGDRKDVRILCEGGGSTPGLAAVKRGSIDLAAVSRHLTRAEDDDDTRAWLIGMDAIVLAVHPSNPVGALTQDQIRAVFEGKITNWSQVGGPNRAIVVLHRSSPDSTTRRGLEEVVLHHVDVTRTARMIDGYLDMVRAVAAEPGAIGYLALRDVDATVRALDVGGVVVKRDTILTGRYPYCRPFTLVSHGRLSGLPAQYLDFARGPDGQALLASKGLIRVR